MRLRLLLIILLLLVVGPACTQDAEEAESPSKEPRGLVICLPKSPLNLDPRYNIDAASYRVTQVMFNGLIKKGPNMTMEPDAAEAWDLENDTTWVFRLKKGIKFHNGREMTAEDVAYTFNSILDPESKSPKRGSFTTIDHIEVRDKYTVAFYTTEPFAPLLVNLILGIVPRDAASEQGEDFAQHPVGTGPFKFKSMEADQFVELEVFEDHFKGRPKIPGIKFRVVPDDTTRYLELIKGNIDLVQNAISSDMIPVVENKEEFQVVKTNGTNYEYLAFNLEDPILSRVDVRRAVAHALNIPEMITSLLNGLARPSTGLLPPGHWAYEPEVAKYDYNPVLAADLLDQAGYTAGPDGVRFTLTYKTSLSDAAKLKAEIVQQQLKEVGIKLDIRGYDWSTLFADIKSGNFQLFSLQWVGISEPDIYHYVFHSDSVPPKGANRGHYLNPEVDALIEEGRRTLDQAKRRAAYSKIQKIIADDLPYVSLWHPTNVVIMKKNLSGFTPYPDGDLSNLWTINWKK